MEYKIHHSIFHIYYLVVIFFLFGGSVFCPEYSSGKQKNGSFMSPEYPYTYQSNRDHTFKFWGEQNERVQIIFDQFDIDRPRPNDVCDKDNSYLTYKTLKSTIYLCGPNKPLPLLSEGTQVILEYKHQIYEPNTQDGNSGFNGTYRFVKNYGIDTGMQKSDDQCTFIYDSSVAKNGTFYSPNFNGSYPEKMKCTYIFTGNETFVKFHFTEFNLLGSPAGCSEVHDSDYLELSETVDQDTKFYYERICGKKESFERNGNLNSSFFVIFRSFSKKNTTNYTYIGFNATYEFTSTPSKGNPVHFGNFSVIFIVHWISYILANKFRYL